MLCNEFVDTASCVNMRCQADRRTKVSTLRQNNSAGDIKWGANEVGRFVSLRGVQLET